MQYNYRPEDLQHYHDRPDVPPEAETAGIAAGTIALILAVVAAVVLMVVLLAWSPWSSGGSGGNGEQNSPVEQEQAPLRDQPQLPRQ